MQVYFDRSLIEQEDHPVLGMSPCWPGVLTKVPAPFTARHHVKVGDPVLRVNDEFLFPAQRVFAGAEQVREMRCRDLLAGEKLIIEGK